jgi:hypothetical protein
MDYQRQQSAALLQLNAAHLLPQFQEEAGQQVCMLLLVPSHQQCPGNGRPALDFEVTSVPINNTRSNSGSPPALLPGGSQPTGVQGHPPPAMPRQWQAST